MNATVKSAPNKRKRYPPEVTATLRAYQRTIRDQDKEYKKMKRKLDKLLKVILTPIIMIILGGCSVNQLIPPMPTYDATSVNEKWGMLEQVNAVQQALSTQAMTLMMTGQLPKEPPPGYTAGVDEMLYFEAKAKLELFHSQFAEAQKSVDASVAAGRRALEILVEAAGNPA